MRPILFSVALDERFFWHHRSEVITLEESDLCRFALVANKGLRTNIMSRTRWLSLLLLLFVTAKELDAFLFKKQQSPQFPAAPKRGRTLVSFSAVGNSDDTRQDADEALEASEQEAVQNVKSCIKMTFLSVLADAATLVSTRVSVLEMENVSAADAYPAWLPDGIFVAWKVYLAVQMGRIVQRIAPQGGKALSKQFTASTMNVLLGFMARVWLISAAVLAALSTAELTTMLSAGGGNTLWLAIPAVMGIVLAWTLRQTRDFSSPLLQPSNKNKNNADETLVLVGNARRTIRNMGLAVAAILLRASVIPIRAWQMEGTWGKRINVLLSWPTPLGLAVLLLKLRSALWRVAAEIQQQGDDGNNNSVTVASKQDLFSAQAAFWGKLAHVFQTEVVFKTLALIVTQAILPNWKK